jgi:hypothetical protein
MGKCLNGGACFNGACVCTKQFYGEFCENDRLAGFNWGWLLLILILLIALGFGVYYILTKVFNFK